jgi:AcrR family transcriptional regulator
MSRTGLTRTLFYRHFDGISALMLAMIQELGGELVAVAEAWAGSERVEPVEARQHLAAFVDFHTRNAPLVRAAVEAAHHDDAVEAAYEGLVERFVAIMQQALVTRSANDPGLDTAEVARALVRMLNGYLGDPRRTPDPERALDAVWTIWMRTLFLDG